MISPSLDLFHAVSRNTDCIGITDYERPREHRAQESFKGFHIYYHYHLSFVSLLKSFERILWLSLAWLKQKSKDSKDNKEYKPRSNRNTRKIDLEISKEYIWKGKAKRLQTRTD